MANYNYFRDYDPRIGRYIESDPLGVDMGLDTYGYVAASPLVDSDSTGLLPDGCLTCIVYAEAGGTNDDCQQGIASVVKNRMGSPKKFPGQGTTCAVASARSGAVAQFDGYGTERYRKCLTGCLSNREQYAADRSFFNSDNKDNTNDSLFFHDKRISTPGYLKRGIRRGEIIEQKVPGCNSFRFYRSK